MNNAISKNIWFPAILCISMISFLLLFPITGHAQDEPCSMRVEVSPYQVNIDSGGVEHYVRILTYAWHSNTSEAFVYIDDNADPIDDEYIRLTRDSYGHLVIKIDLVAIQDAELEVDTHHDLKIVAVLKTPTDECMEVEGTGEIYIIGKSK